MLLWPVISAMCQAAGVGCKIAITGRLYTYEGGFRTGPLHAWVAAQVCSASFAANALHMQRATAVWGCNAYTTLKHTRLQRLRCARVVGKRGNVLLGQRGVGRARLVQRRGALPRRCQQRRAVLVHHRLRVCKAFGNPKHTMRQGPRAVPARP